MRNSILSAAVLAGFGLAAVGAAEAATVTYTDLAQFQAAAGSLTTEGFEAAPWSPNTTMAQGTTSLGVSWTAANSLYAGGFLPHTGSTSLTSLDTPNSDLFDSLAAILPGGVTAVGGWITSYNQLHNVTISAYDASDVLLGTAVMGPTGNGYLFFGLTSDTAIARITLASTGVTNPIGDDFALDDFVFGAAGPSNPPPTGVPEPAGVALFGAGLIGLGLLRRKRRG